MLQYEELRLRLLEHKKPLEDVSEALGLEKMKEEIARLEKMAADESFWSDLENSQKVLQKTSSLKNRVAAYEKQLMQTSAKDLARRMKLHGL